MEGPSSQWTIDARLNDPVRGCGDVVYKGAVHAHTGSIRDETEPLFEGAGQKPVAIVEAGDVTKPQVASSQFELIRTHPRRLVPKLGSGIKTGGRYG